MLFHEKIIATLEASDNVNSILWSNFYDHGEISGKDINELANTFYTWQNIKQPSDFAEFMLDNPHYGILIYDTRHRLRTIHAIKHANDNIFTGVTLNLITSNPIEFEVKASALKHSIPFTNTDNVATNRPLRSTPTTSTLDELKSEDRETRDFCFRRFCTPCWHCTKLYVTAKSCYYRCLAGHVEHRLFYNFRIFALWNSGATLTRPIAKTTRTKVIMLVSLKSSFLSNLKNIKERYHTTNIDREIVIGTFSSDELAE